MKKLFIGGIGLAGESVFLNVERFHKDGETINANNMHVEPGGKAYNQLIQARRLGSSCMFFSAMGNDSYKDVCINYLSNEGIQSYTEIINNKNTAFATIITNKNGDNQVTVYKGAATDLSIDFINKNIENIKKCSLLLLSLEVPLEIVLRALEIAEENNIFTILNPAPAIKIDASILKRFNLITPNFSEIQVLLNRNLNDINELKIALDEFGLDNVIVTLGSNGALLYKNKTAYHFPPVKANAVDTTGAGDSFNGALAHMINSGYDLDDAIKFAINASSISVRKKYAVDSFPKYDDVNNNYVKIKKKLFNFYKR